MGPLGPLGPLGPVGWSVGLVAASIAVKHLSAPFKKWPASFNSQTDTIHKILGRFLGDSYDFFGDSLGVLLRFSTSDFLWGFSRIPKYSERF